MAATKRPTTVERAAIAWWEDKRPCVFTLDEHLANPTINTTTDSEKELALRVSLLVRLNRPEKRR